MFRAPEPRSKSLRLLGWITLSASLHAAALGATGFAAKARQSPTFDRYSQTLQGETLDLESPPPQEATDEAEPSAATAGPSTPAPTAAPASTSSPAAARAPAATAAMRPAAVPALFGAIGVRFATDLATTFTRAFPQAGSADPVWTSVPFGSAGRAEVTLALDTEGHLAASEVTGTPSPALRRSIERTLALLAPRAFTSRAAITVLRVSAHVSHDDVHDGLHGDVFALSAGSFSGDVGAAFFALPPSSGPGRRVDVEVRLMP